MFLTWSKASTIN